MKVKEFLKCTGACAQGCLKKNIKSNNTYLGEKS